MNMQQAKMFVRSLSNSAAKILVSFLMARTALDAKDLHEWTGMKRETLYSGLDLLHSSGMIERQMGEHGRHTWIPAGDFLPGIFQMSEKRTSENQMSTKRTPVSLIVGGGDSELINLIPTTTTTTSSQMSAKRTPEAARVAKLLQHTHLLFDGSFVNSKGLELCDPETVLAWCAYGYQQFRQGLADRPAGLVRRKLLDVEPPPQPLLDNWVNMLPESYLEVIGEISYTCDFCIETFGQRQAMNDHVRVAHPYICDECHQPTAFETQAEWKAHYAAKHDPFRTAEILPPVEFPIVSPGMEFDLDQIWQTVLGTLQMEMPRASFDTWVRDTQVVRYDGQTMTVATRNAYARDWLTNRLTATIEKILIGLLNQPEPRIRFETPGRDA